MPDSLDAIRAGAAGPAAAAAAGLSDYHLHTPLCRHADGAPSEYARAAVGLGLAEIGFADHNPMPEPFDDWRMDLDQLPRYLDWIAETRVQFVDLPIRLGLECDFFPGQTAWIERLAGRAPWDYLIGSVHYLGAGWDVDNPRFVHRFDELPVAEIWGRYAARLVACIRTRLFDFVAHPDLPKKFGHRPAGDLRRYYEPVVAALAETGTAYEINTAGLRKPAGEVYPAPAFLRLAREAGVPVVINSDAHAPGEVGAGFAVARQLAREAGYTETVRFEGRRRTAVPLPAAVLP